MQLPDQSTACQAAAGAAANGLHRQRCCCHPPHTCGVTNAAGCAANCPSQLSLQAPPPHHCSSSQPCAVSSTTVSLACAGAVRAAHAPALHRPPLRQAPQGPGGSACHCMAAPPPATPCNARRVMQPPGSMLRTIHKLRCMWTAGACMQRKLRKSAGCSAAGPAAHHHTRLGPGNHPGE